MAKFKKPLLVVLKIELFVIFGLNNQQVRSEDLSFARDKSHIKVALLHGKLLRFKILYHQKGVKMNSVHHQVRILSIMTHPKDSSLVKQIYLLNYLNKELSSKSVLNSKLGGS